MWDELWLGTLIQNNKKVRLDQVAAITKAAPATLHKELFQKKNGKFISTLLDNRVRVSGLVQVARFDTTM